MSSAEGLTCILTECRRRRTRRRRRCGSGAGTVLRVKKCCCPSRRLVSAPATAHLETFVSLPLLRPLPRPRVHSADLSRFPDDPTATPLRPSAHPPRHATMPPHPAPYPLVESPFDLVPRDPTLNERVLGNGDAQAAPALTARAFARRSGAEAYAKLERRVVAER